MSSIGSCFDIGMATCDSLNTFERRQNRFAKEHNIPPEQMDYFSNEKLLNKFHIYCSEDEVAGNGALMRLAPVPLFFYRYPQHAVEYSGRIDRNFYSKHTTWFNEKRLYNGIKAIAEGSYQRPGGYIVDALEAALWAFWSDGDSFEKGALEAVNLGDDTDTTAAIYGQLAGAYYG
jgi:ADP-ribosyl-[dinitrogen reductase] hydrolase